MELLYSQPKGTRLYNLARKWFILLSLLTSPVLLIINAPFGKFTPSNPSSLFLVDGITSWIVMELISPLSFTISFLLSPLSYHSPQLPSPTSPIAFLITLYFIHYSNRAIISPLRTPSRSKSHLIVPLAGVIFNTINGSLLGSYFSSPFARIYLAEGYTYWNRWEFWVGLVLWAGGFVGNVVHDEILLDIRRKAGVKSKEEGKGKGTDEYYGIPQGLLFKYISYPNYFLEWIEWLGFALMAAPFPISLSFLPPSSLLSSLTSDLSSLPSTLTSLLLIPPHLFLPSLSPPYIFLIAEILLMFPRAYKGHRWYKKKFGDAYPRERKAVVPFLV